MKTQEIPLSHLKPSDTNVRKTEQTEGILELAASIKAHGLIHPLLVRPGGEKELIEVVAGGRRMAAMLELVDQGEMDADDPVSCRVIHGDTSDPEAAELSLIENEYRVAMHPADQITAFRKLASGGSSVGQIAARFGYSERTVRQRLALAGVCDEVLDRYRDGKINMDMVRAYAVTDDQDRQREVLAHIESPEYRGWNAASEIRSQLLPEGAQRASNMRTAKHIGLEAYEAAGGQVDHDLFSRNEEHGAFIADPGLMERLSLEKLEEHAAALEDDWKWAEARLSFEFADRAEFTVLDPEPKAEDVKAVNDLADAAEAAEETGVANSNEDNGEWRPEDLESLQNAERVLHKAERRMKERAVWTEALRRVSGCVVTLDYNGKIQVYEGLVQPEDAEEASEAIPGVDGKTPTKTPRVLPKALHEDLSRVRSAFGKATLKYDDAFNLLTYGMVRREFGEAWHSPAIDVRIERTPDRSPRSQGEDEMWSEASPGEVMIEKERLALRETLIEVGWLEPDGTRKTAASETGPTFDRFMSLSLEVRKRFFRFCVLQGLNPQLSVDKTTWPELEQVYAARGVRFERVRPTGRMFWHRRSKKDCIAIVTEVLGEEEAAKFRPMKKAELVPALEKAFARGPGKKWMLTGFAPDVPDADCTWPASDLA